MTITTKIAAQLAREIEAETRKAERIKMIRIAIAVIGGMVASFSLGIAIGRMM